MTTPTSLILRILVVLVCFLTPLAASADAFIPTMISANVVWIVTLPLVVSIEGWLMVRWKWQQPLENSIKGNLWSMLAAFPLGIGLSALGGYFASEDAQITLAFIPEPSRWILAQTFLYGQTSTPVYGFIDDAETSGIILAALLFMGICWLLTFLVEGCFYKIKNPSLSSAHVYRRTALANLVSYGALMLLWVPYSYHTASSGENDLRKSCADMSSLMNRCPDIWVKFPEVKEARLRECRVNGLQVDICLTRSNARINPTMRETLPDKVAPR